MELLPTVLQAVPGEDFTVYAYFNDGTVRKADIKPIIREGGVFSRLADEKFFRERLTVLNDAVAWDVTGTFDNTKCIDLDPLVMYRNSPVVPDPLEQEDFPAAQNRLARRNSMSDERRVPKSADTF